MKKVAILIQVLVFTAMASNVTHAMEGMGEAIRLIQREPTVRGQTELWSSCRQALNDAQEILRNIMQMRGCDQESDEIREQARTSLIRKIQNIFRGYGLSAYDLRDAPLDLITHGWVYQACLNQFLSSAGMEFSGFILGEGWAPALGFLQENLTPISNVGSAKELPRGDVIRNGSWNVDRRFLPQADYPTDSFFTQTCGKLREFSAALPNYFAGVERNISASRSIAVCSAPAVMEASRALAPQSRPSGELMGVTQLLGAVAVAAPLFRMGAGARGAFEEANLTQRGEQALESLFVGAQGRTLALIRAGMPTASGMLLLTRATGAQPISSDQVVLAVRDPARQGRISACWTRRSLLCEHFSLGIDAIVALNCRSSPPEQSISSSQHGPQGDVGGVRVHDSQPSRSSGSASPAR